MADSELEREARTRTLTERGDELFQNKKVLFVNKLKVAWSFVEPLLKEVNYNDIEGLKTLDNKICMKYGELRMIIREYRSFLRSTRTEESEKLFNELDQYDADCDDTVHSVLRKITEALTNEDNKSVRSRLSGRSTSSSVKAKARLEAAKARIEFSKKELELKKKQALLEEEKTVTLAKAHREGKVIQAELEMLNEQKVYAEAEAENDVFETISEYDSQIRSGNIDVIYRAPDNEEKASNNERTEEYVNDQMKYVERDHPKVNYLDKDPPEISRPDSNGNVFVPSHPSEMFKDFGQFLIKKDIMLQRFSKFQDDPTHYVIWKNTFKDIVSELQCTPSEEIDLLMKWLGPESSKQASNLRAANSHDAATGLIKIWERLEERYGAPEMVEEKLRKKLDLFPRMSGKDYKKLYELSDILSEIESVKENHLYANMLSYFDSPMGVNPIVNKLPVHIQNKWNDRGRKYKVSHSVSFPPFNFFVSFVKEMCCSYNDPSFGHSTEFVRDQVKLRGEPCLQFGTQERKPPAFSTGRGKVVLARKTDVNKSESVKSKIGCPIHKSVGHVLGSCRNFQSETFDKKRKILRENKLCYRCFSPEHMLKNCDSNLKCSVCSSITHHTLLHVNGLSENGGERMNQSVASNCTQICDSKFSGKSCGKIVLVSMYSRSRPEHKVKVYAILDEQSNRTLAKPKLFSLLGLYGQKFEYTLKTCSGSVTASGRRATDCIIESLNGRVSYSLPTVIECTHIPDNRDEIPVPRVAAHHPHLKDIASSIPDLDESVDILLLVGRDLIDAHHILDQRIGPPGTPYAQQLSLGWVVVGETCLGRVHASDTVSVNKTFILPNGRASLCEPCTSSLRLVDNPKSDIGSDIFVKTGSDELVGPSVEDREFIGIMDQHMRKSPSGHWSAPLPFRSPCPCLPDNRQQVWDRAKRLDASLKRNPEKLSHFVDFMKGVIDSGHAELAPIDHNSPHWYLPIFGVYHPQKPGQIRGVFDASARYGDISLNETLLSGPDLTNNLLGVLLRFRKEAVAVMADIEKMFYCFLVDECHRNYLRFFWYRDNDPTKELVEFRMCVHVFGNKPSPAVATYGLRRSVENSSSDVKKFVTDNFYVDDGLVSLPSSAEAIDLVSRTQLELKNNGRLRLHKIASNSSEVMSSFPVQDLAKDLRQLDLLVDDLPMQRSLGMQWNLESDSFMFHVSLDEKPFTRRGVLSVISSVYDPLGLIAPIIVSGKLFLKELIQQTSDWDKPLPVSKLDQWERWKDSLGAIKQLEIPRMYLPITLSSARNVQLYVYSDASEKAIAAVAYIVSLQDGVWYKGFVLGKAKVAPKSGHTIPRLELCAAVLAVEIYEIVEKNLAVEFDNVSFFTDSRVVLGYIQNRTRRFYTYVSNRVERIHRSTNPSQWTYVRTDLNPADSATRSLHASEMLNSPWLHGPVSLPPSKPCPVDVTFPLVEPEEDKEIRPVICTLSTIIKTNMLGSERFERFSSWSSLVSAVSLLVHIAQTFRYSSSCEGWHICSKSRSVDCRLQAEHVIIRSAQVEVFSDEISHLESGTQLLKSSTLFALSPILDEKHILRVGGRLRLASLTSNEKNPVIVPKKCHLAVLLARHYHIQVAHQGRHITEGAIRLAGFWIVGCKRLVSSMIANCVRCRRLRGNTESQKMADLPTDRLTPNPPFSFVGVDTFGPWEVVARRTRGGQANNKRWAIMFTCLGTRAVHIEVVESMSSSSFINAMRRLMALRGPVSQFRSDRGTNFVGASNELSTEIESINVEEESVKKFLTDKSCVWRFNPPHASHMGGVWERMIGVTRNILNSMLLDVSTKHLSHEVLCTLMAEVTAIINARPLVAVSSDPDCPEILTPAALVTQKTSPPVNLQYHPVDPRTQWKYVQALADTFWKRWRVEYVQTLQVRRKWQSVTPNLKQGDVVLLRDKERFRNDWPLGVVVRVFPSDDQKVRQVEVKISNRGKCQTYVRPISELVLLLSGEE